jgi:hypothetical protein
MKCSSRGTITLALQAPQFSFTRSSRHPRLARTCHVVPFFLMSALAFLASVAAAQTSPILTGYVTAIGTPAEFSVDRSQVHCTATTRLTLVHDGDRVPVSGCPLRSLGEAVTVYGKRDKTSGIVTAVLIESAAPADREIEGFAVIDRIVAAPDASGSVTVSADGYSIAIPAAIHPVFLPPLTE